MYCQQQTGSFTLEISEIFSISRILPAGFPIISPKRSLVLGVIAASHADKSAGSTKCTLIDSFFNVFVHWVMVPP